MHFATLFTAVAALASTSMALPTAENSDNVDKRTMIPNQVSVNVVAVKGMIPGQTKQDIVVPLGKLTYFKDVQFTELRIKSINKVAPVPMPDINKIVCQRFRDEFGAQTGSEAFTVKKGTVVDTNAIPLGWVLCYMTGYWLTDEAGN
ncbi:hypothetical protein FALBO_2626 [Fusarium albosuccineum]|uniref:Uncharacterized protein n=1 Tax=Fusarium albosuccineum TaxID=1237068 RepID=A0A8H4LLU2_9HYPO|nr:hypothetical protein FALBO_2626 [Fusarium albosuccineum]